MNNKVKNLIIVFLTFLFAIFLLNILIKEIETNKSDITNMNILNYIPSNYEITILSNATSNNIKNYINENILEQKKDELNMIKDSLISYLGFNLQEKIKDIYDNEFAITFFENKLNKKDILLIFKLKKNKDINDIINIKELNKSDQIIELKRNGKLNYIRYIFLTKDNYIIASSNKDLINSSLQANKGNEILSKNSIPDDLNLKGIKLLSISNYINLKNNPNSEAQTFNKLITIIDSEDNKIKLRSFSPNINKINTKIINNKIDNIKDIIFTNRFPRHKENINSLFNDINHKDFIEEVFKEVNDELLLITNNNNNWVLCFKSKLPKKISIDQLNSLKKFKKEDLYINDINYSIYINDRLEIKDNSIIYEKDNPIFILKNEENTFISNNFDTLLYINEKANLIDQYFNNDIKTYKYILNDIFFIRYIDNTQLVESYKFLKNLQYFINTELFSLEDIRINISLIIPEQDEKVYIESNLKIL